MLFTCECLPQFRRDVSVCKHFKHFCGLWWTHPPWHAFLWEEERKTCNLTPTFSLPSSLFTSQAYCGERGYRSHSSLRAVLLRSARSRQFALTSCFLLSGSVWQAFVWLQCFEGKEYGTLRSHRQQQLDRILGRGFILTSAATVLWATAFWTSGVPAGLSSRAASNWSLWLTKLKCYL